MKKNSKGSIKGDVCRTRACVWLGLEHVGVGNFASWYHVQGQKSTDGSWKSVGDYDDTLTAEKCLKRNIQKPH